DGCGVYGRSITTTNYGYLGAHNVGAYGQHFSSGNYGSLGKSDCGVYGKGASGYAGKFDGNVYMTGFKMPTGAANGRVLTSDANGTGTWTQMSSGSDNDWTVSGNNMYSAVSGNVGIGITNPAKKLDVREEIQTTSASSSSRHLRIFSADDQRIIATDDLTFRYADGSPSEGALIFKENHTERVRFDKGGKVGIGTSTPGNILTIKQASATDPIADSWTTYSSRRWKTNIKPIDNAISLVKNLTGVSYDWKTGGKSDIGLIAEEVGDVIPEIVAYEENGVDAKSVDYSRLVAVLIQGMKEQQDTIDKLENRIKALENEDR
nr:tail fiber domain-containing protein [candidate division KSB1 bacterium]